MTDRELLELAAKAAGLQLVWGDKYKLGDDEIDCTDIPYVHSGQPDEGDVHWNPLTDDGDALRLAVRCSQLYGFYRFFRAWLVAMATEEPSSPTDPCAPTRRAIVRAAAEIGKGMK